MVPLDEDQAFITAIETGEVNKPTKVHLNLVNSIPLPAGSIITIDLPKMNSEAPPSLRKNYIFDVGNLDCSAIQNVDAGL